METILRGACCAVNPNNASDSEKDNSSAMGDLLLDINSCHYAVDEFYGDHIDLRFIVPIVLRKMQNETGTKALHFLYKLCDNRNRHNRIPIVRNKSFDVLNALINRISREDCDGLNLALILLNNLLIPYRNKVTIILSDSAGNLLDCLTRIMGRSIPEKVLACICLVNLSLIPESKKPILYHSPLQDWCPELSLHSNPESTIQILERNLILKFPSTPVILSFEKEVLRWSCNLAKSLCFCEESAKLLAMSNITRSMLNLLQKSTLPPASWDAESVEDAALRGLFEFASWPILRISLLEANVPNFAETFSECYYRNDRRSYQLFCLLDTVDESQEMMNETVV